MKGFLSLYIYDEQLFDDMEMCLLIFNLYQLDGKINNKIINCKEFLRQMKFFHSVSHRKEILQNTIYKKCDLIQKNKEDIITEMDKIKKYLDPSIQTNQQEVIYKKHTKEEI